ncbi:hypothetical protein VNO80_00362 [Phaseolus coccineus]|uniref:PGG domain-containing protein n=1 Tax=Phaseolus coccineus TaxID=3886 RepID=A0AAN9RM48_PHACN
MSIYVLLFWLQNEQRRCKRQQICNKLIPSSPFILKQEKLIMQDISVAMEEKLKEEKKWWKKGIEKMTNWLAIKNKDEWLKDMRGNLSLAATIITTMTFQTAINPPGGVRPATENGYVECPKNLDGNPCPGESVLAIVHPEAYVKFLLSNTICFVSSLAMCLLLVSGFPLNHRFFIWLLSICMCITMTTLTLTYMIGADMVTPYPIWYKTQTMYNYVLYIWLTLVALVTLVLCLRLFVWFVTKCLGKRKR